MRLDPSYNRLQTERFPLVRMRGGADSASSGLDIFFSTCVQMSLGTGRSDAPPRFIFTQSRTNNKIVQLDNI